MKGSVKMNFLEKYKKEFEEYDKLDHDFIDDDKIWSQLLLPN